MGTIRRSPIVQQSRKLFRRKTLTSTASGIRRPGVVTFVGIVVYIQAFIAAAFAVVLFIERNNKQYQLVTGQSDSDILVNSIVEGIVALALFAVGYGLLSGSKGFRLFVAIVMGVRIVASAYWMLTHHAGGYDSAAIVTILIGIFVLWALYGHKESDAYFEGHL